MSMKHLLTIFQEEGDYEHEIDIAIMKALQKARKNEDDGIKHLLELAVICNQPDIARKKIFTNYANDQVIVNSSGHFSRSDHFTWCNDVNIHLCEKIAPLPKLTSLPLLHCISVSETPSLFHGNLYFCNDPYRGYHMFVIRKAFHDYREMKCYYDLLIHFFTHFIRIGYGLHC
uniref:Uncharacterized protein n=1 Tax=Eptatretus burgeri TaxID=7764 RepID=A0A8C4QPX5_EPTBU